MHSQVGAGAKCVVCICVSPDWLAGLDEILFANICADSAKCARWSGNVTFESECSVSMWSPAHQELILPDV